MYITSVTMKLLCLKIKGYKTHIQLPLIGKGRSELLTKIISNSVSTVNVDLYQICRLGSVCNIQEPSVY
jgi:hypothetical protein